jgi:hypothetical protein
MPSLFLNLGSIYAQCVSVPFPINWNRTELVLAAESCQPIRTENRTADQKRRKKAPKRNGFIDEEIGRRTIIRPAGPPIARTAGIMI